MQKNEIEPSCIPLTKINSKWMKGLSIRLETLKPPEENRGEKLLRTGLGRDFLDMTPKAQTTKAKINNWDCSEQQSFCTAKETINTMKGKAVE